MAFQLTQGNPAFVSMYAHPLAAPTAGGFTGGVMPRQEQSAEMAINEARLAFERDQLNRQMEQAAANRVAGQETANADRASNFQLGMAPWNFKDKVFQTVSPLLTGLLGTGAGGQSPLVGGQTTPAPAIDANPIWNPQQVNQQVNATKAGNAASAATQQQQAARKTAGQGFGSRSPLLAALNSGIDQSRMAADADADREIRWGAAEGNAGHVLKAQTANADVWKAQNQIDVERRKANNQYVSSLASIIGGLM